MAPCSLDPTLFFLAPSPHLLIQQRCITLVRATLPDILLDAVEEHVADGVRRNAQVNDVEHVDHDATQRKADNQQQQQRRAGAAAFELEHVRSMRPPRATPPCVRAHHMPEQALDVIRRGTHPAHV